MSDQSIADTARALAAALLAASEQGHAYEEPQRQISALERELINKYREETRETVRI